MAVLAEGKAVVLMTNETMPVFADVFCLLVGHTRPILMA